MVYYYLISIVIIINILKRALTPIGETYSTDMFIAVRFMMGLCQCIVCVFLPLWTNENSPRDQRTTWMSYLQVTIYTIICLPIYIYIVISSNNVISSNDNNILKSLYSYYSTNFSSIFVHMCYVI